MPNSLSGVHTNLNKVENHVLQVVKHIDSDILDLLKWFDCAHCYTKCTHVNIHINVLTDRSGRLSRNGNGCMAYLLCQYTYCISHQVLQIV